MNRKDRRAMERTARRHLAKRAGVMTAIDSYVQRRIDLARTKEPRAAADDLYQAARDFRKEAQAARNRGDEEACERVLQQALALEDAAGAFTADL